MAGKESLQQTRPINPPCASSRRCGDMRHCITKRVCQSISLFHPSIHITFPPVNLYHFSTRQSISFLHPSIHTTFPPVNPYHFTTRQSISLFHPSIHTTFPPVNPYHFSTRQSISLFHPSIHIIFIFPPVKDIQFAANFFPIRRCFYTQEFRVNSLQLFVNLIFILSYSISVSNLLASRGDDSSIRIWDLSGNLSQPKLQIPLKIISDLLNIYPSANVAFRYDSYYFLYLFL